MRRLTWFNATSLTLGLAFLYLPMLILIIYSFNASRLVTVWAGFSTQWYVTLFSNQGFIDAAKVTLKVAVACRSCFCSSASGSIAGSSPSFSRIPPFPWPSSRWWCRRG
jgi:ABC-type spermidine/putrescine transport system permease subunit II